MGGPVVGSRGSIARSLCRGLTWASLLAGGLGPAHAVDVDYPVQPGDNPWTITVRLLRGIDYWPRLQKYNRISDPYHILPGTVLRIPEAWFALRSEAVHVVAVEGEVSVQDPQGSLGKLAAGDLLEAGSVVRSSDQASLTLGLADESRVLVRGESELEVVSNRTHPYGRARDVRLELRRGAVENRVEHRDGAAGRFEIRTPAAVAAVRGTRFRVSAEPGRTVTEVVEGRVLAASTPGTSGAAARVELAGGYGAVFGAADPPAPRVLLAAPAADALPSLIERMPVELPIDPVAGAVAYRTLVSAQPGFETVISDQRSALAVMRIRDIPDGDYYARLRGVDSRGVEGFEGERRITINARPEPPFLVSPEAGAVIAEARPVFGWTRRAAGATYHFQLARDDRFQDLVIDRSGIGENRFAVPEALDPGAYFWRVLAIAPDEGAGPFGDPQALRRLPDAPVMQAAGAGANPRIRWQGGGPGDHYRLQLAREDSFAEPIVDTELKQAEYALEGLAPGRYSARVRTLSADGYASPWGDTQQVELASEHDRSWLLLVVPILIGL